MLCSILALQCASLKLTYVAGTFSFWKKVRGDVRGDKRPTMKKKLLKVPSDVGKEAKKRKLVARGDDSGSTTPRRHFYHYLSCNQKTLVIME
jgi:hypothetical protein